LEIDTKKEDFYDLFQDEILRYLKELKNNIQQEHDFHRLTLTIGNPQFFIS
jgi:hypothetical protein